MVAPIALYPDSLVAQILAASTFPEQVIDADQWVQSHPDFKGEALAQAVDQLPWDPSVKALAAFPSVLGNMDKNLSWTSSLGDAYNNQEQNVMDAIQAMRQRAQEAGNLNSTPEQTVTTESSDIEIEPVSPEIIYVPAYDPWIVHGGPIVAWPGWYPYPGIWYDGPSLFFGGGFGIGFFGGYGWGWHHWGCDWHHHYAVYDNGRYYSRSRTFYNRERFYRGEGARGVYNRAERTPQPSGGDRGGPRSVDKRSERTPQPFGGDREAARGYAKPDGQSDVGSDAFSGFGRGGEERSFSSRGNASFGVTLYIGAENWPTPIPLSMKGNLWFFDTEAGKRESLFRRIGRNEYSAIRICQELVAAQKEYYAMQHNECAKQIFSDEGQHNGLYWKVLDREPQSPIGPLVASAVAEGYAEGKGAPPTPYRGYFFHILTRQGKDAVGGAKRYIVKDKMTEGFAFLAYPAEYRSSGVMTFIVNQDGVVYQKDLGKKTEALGKSMREYNPDFSWSKADEEPAQTAAGQKQ